jgi:putative Mg2+ transporter-C (MgtC) family protein
VLTSWPHDVLPLLVSLVLGTLLGWERQADRKPAGLRTHTLVCLGSTMFILTGRHAAEAFGGSADPTRVLHGIVTGVGFLGAGAILRQSGSIMGLTTAASIWMVAAIGAAAGVEAYALAGVGAALALIVLRVYVMIDRWLSPGQEER